MAANMAQNPVLSTLQVIIPSQHANVHKGILYYCNFTRKETTIKKQGPALNFAHSDVKRFMAFCHSFRLFYPSRI
jgi:hypothetical protein